MQIIGTVTSYLRIIGKQNHIKKSGDGGYKTALNPDDIPETHQKFFREQKLYHIDGCNNCFVHAGFNRLRPFEGQREQDYFWDRTLWKNAVIFKEQIKEGSIFKIATQFNEIFIGHTGTMNFKTDKPMHIANIWNLDTCGRGGKLTIMDINTKEFWQSDPLLLIQ